MAQHKQEENATDGMPMPMEEEEEQQEAARACCSRDLQGGTSVMSSLLAAGSLRSTAEQDLQSGSGIRSLSFSKLLSFRIARAPSSLTSSLDIDELAAAADAHTVPVPVGNSSCAKKKQQQQQAEQHICRSQSLPMSMSTRRFNLKRVADSSSEFRFRVSGLESEAAAAAESGDIAAEEAVCRICMVALSESEGSALKLECRCKGELALAHRECAVKWFRIKGNANCDVCNHDVLNLPVTLRRVQSAAAPTNAAAAETSSSRCRVWHGTPILVIISMLAYFCFLEQLLVGDHGTAALAISLPFACVLGLFSSLTTTKMVSRRCVWLYSAVQFLFIVLFTHLFYRYVRMQAVIAIILSTFAGFGVAICANAVLLQIMRWRARHPPAQAQQDLETAQPPLP